ncbi:hypothetical protein CIB48_g11378 [Xylaria polymorpha]|nr:hypothetical protein CIB48_g11378 [Xylaria polymorpha]
MPSQSFSYSFVSTSTSANGGAPQSTAHVGGGSATSQQNRITDVSDAKERERSYEEKMEDEYAKREGGA